MRVYTNPEKLKRIKEKERIKSLNLYLTNTIHWRMEIK